jgi:hypothetical protein
VLDLEPQGPLPTQIYWRRRALALGVAVLVIGVIVSIIVVVVKNTGGPDAENTAADKPVPAAEAPPTPLPGENPDVKTPVVPPAAQAPAPSE